MLDFIPYYYELRLGGHLACALCASFAGGTLLWAAQYFKTDKAYFFTSFGVSLFLSTILWVLPLELPQNGNVSEISIALIIVVAYPIIKYIFGHAWSISAFVWSAYLFSQLAVFFTAYYYLQ